LPRTGFDMMCLAEMPKRSTQLFGFAAAGNLAHRETVHGEPGIGHASATASPMPPAA
jgi:hypothetical protein